MAEMFSNCVDFAANIITYILYKTFQRLLFFSDTKVCCPAYILKTQRKNSISVCA